MKVKIQNRSVYHKFAEIEIEIPDDWNNKDGEENYYDEHIGDYLHDNEHLYVEKIDEAIDKAEYIHGSGLYDYRGMDDESDDEWRYECEKIELGGHL